MADLELDLKRELVAKRQRQQALTNEYEGLKAEANRVVGEAQGKIKENDISLQWLEQTLKAAGIDTSPEALAKDLADAAPVAPQDPPPAPPQTQGKPPKAGNGKGTAKSPKPAPEAPQEAQAPTPSA